MTNTTAQASQGQVRQHLFLQINPSFFACAIGTEVNSLLLELHMHLDETWLLPQSETLCMIRYNNDHHEEARKEPQVHERELDGGMEDGAQSLKTLWTPRAHGALTTRAHSVPPTYPLPPATIYFVPLALSGVSKALDKILRELCSSYLLLKDQDLLLGEESS